MLLLYLIAMMFAKWQIRVDGQLQMTRGNTVYFTIKERIGLPLGTRFHFFLRCSLNNILLQFDDIESLIHIRYYSVVTYYRMLLIIGIAFILPLLYGT
jgi:hypothetical protein